jgi:hypothetical protein
MALAHTVVPQRFGSEQGWRFYACPVRFQMPSVYHKSPSLSIPSRMGLERTTKAVKPRSSLTWTLIP